ncbi:NfeD family protein [Alteromonas sediminis]|uniref:NfeD family protein n=1 Tax=Alteromonas sediminis TaxID=2259342 RepID=A0A3N5YCP1_9ALTE|nr:NfeD family protein [Alteromonas sediminis]RPJ67065.1 NfeD family protein [Alteromonas sediminis]
MDAEITNLANYLIIAGLIILAVEILLLGLSTFVLTFFGLSLLITGVLVMADGISPTLMAATTSVAVLSALLAIVLWKPMKSLQNKTERKQAQSDLIGYRFELDSTLSPTKPGSVTYSGITWKVVSDSMIPAGTEVETIEVKVGQWKVKAVDD